MDIKLTPWQRKAAYILFALFAFAFAMRATLPVEAVRDRIVMEAAAQGWQVSVSDVGPAGLLGVSMRDVTLESRDGLRIPIDRLDATVRLWPLLLGRRGVGFDIRAFDGRVQGFTEQSGAASRLVAKVSGVDLGQAPPVRKATGLDLAGVVEGDIDLSLDEKEPPKSTGHIDLAVQDAVLRGGQLPIPGMASALTVPRVALGEVTAKAAVKDGRITFDKLGAKSEDLELDTQGLYVVLQPRLAFAPIFGKAKLKLNDALWRKSGTAGFKGLAEMALAQAKGRDGSYGFQIYGTLARPQTRMSPER
jgi:type II secretion system protein N